MLSFPNMAASENGSIPPNWRANPFPQCRRVRGRSLRRLDRKSRELPNPPVEIEARISGASANHKQRRIVLFLGSMAEPGKVVTAVSKQG
jgi:hypothetical protein